MEIYITDSGHLVINERSFGPDMDDQPMARQLFRAFGPEERPEIWKAYAAYRGRYDPSRHAMVSRTGYVVPVR